MVMTTIVSASASACSSPSSLISVRYGGEFRGHQSSQWMRRRTAVVFCNLLAFRGNSAACLSRRRFTSTQGRRSGSITRTRVSSITSSNSEGVSESQLFRVGPLPGDIAEVEGFCRIFRAAEQLHSAIMKTLCDPVTGECAVTYDESDDNILGDVPVLEEKVVAALACMGSLLQRGKEEVLFGRPVQKGFNNVAEWNDGKLPPLASFREEMKHCCLKLQNAIESYFLPSDERTHDIWMKLQRLKNVSYDAGFPRPEGSPFHAVLPNWYAVRLFPIKSRSEANDSEVAFWRGGQVTEEGFKWLLERGYKTIVDLRAERNEDYWADAAVEEAVNLGKIQLIHIPVKIGNAPSKKQVDEFADLLQNRDRMPLYLHSQEGVLRASAMVSRWREVALRSRSTLSSSSMPNANQMLSFNFQNHDMGSNGKYPTTDLLKAQETDRDGNYKNGNGQNGSFMKSYQTHEAKQQFEPSLHGKGANIMDSIKDCVNGGKKLESNDKDNQNSSLTESWWHISPFEAQRPSCNIFSRKEMSQMLKDRKITPKLYSKGSSKMRHTYSKNTQSLVIGTSKLSCLQAIDSTMPSHVSSSSNSLGKTFVKGHSKNSNRLPYSNTDTRSQTTDVSGKVMLMDVNKINKHLADNNKVVSEIDPKSVSHVQPFVDSTSNGNGDIAHVDGNMCASTTGVVRLQSRKKAEMYLVRTDGFSCSRERVKESSLAFTHPSTQQQMLMWKTPPKTVLLLKKLGQELMEEAKQVASFLHFKEKMNVVVEPELHDLFSRVTGYGFIQTFYNQDLSNLHERVDLVACLGGDGLILHASNLFRQAVPPVVSFNLGSLGFLTAHPFADYQRDLSAIIHGNNMVEGVYITLRMRLRCQIFRKGKVVPGKLFEILNEVAVDRGSSPYLCKIECYERNCLITKVQADGVIVATPTGSTAYSTSAGGSMVHPNVPCMLFTPICPHSLSFRPVILPDSAQLILKIPDDARSNAWVSFDGKRRQQLLKGDSVHICMSEHPLPTVNKSDQTGDWFKSLVRCLNWNDRLEQKSFL